MSSRLVSLAVVVTALTCYHLAQRAMPGAIRPAPLFTLVYGVAAVALVGGMLVGRSLGGMHEITVAASHWAPWMLVGSVVGIELGVYAMYRSGWSISTASVSTQAIVAALLVIVGLVRFSESLTISRSAGLALCVVGAGLVAR
jgi:hypothetical protein